MIRGKRLCLVTWVVCLAIGATLVATPAAASPRAVGRFDEPTYQSTVNPTFAFSGFVYDSVSGSGHNSQVDAVHFWAVPLDGSSSVFLTATTCDPASACNFSLTGSGLTPGQSYTLVAYAHLVATARSMAPPSPGLPSPGSHRPR